jgi:hypothetical protein
MVFRPPEQGSPTRIARHPTSLPGHTPEDLAKALCNLRYDALGSYLEAIAKQLLVDADADWDRGRTHPSDWLRSARHHLLVARGSIDSAWRICLKHMDLTESREPPDQSY